MAKFTKSTEKKGASAAAPAKIAANGGVQKTKKANKPAVAPAVRAAAIAEAKVAKVVAVVTKPVAKQANKPVVAKAAAKPAKSTAGGVKKERTGFSVFVGNLPAKVKRPAIEKLFKPHAAVGTIRLRKSNGAKLFKRDTDQQSAIIAFVDVASTEEATRVAKALNGTKLGENVLRVDAHNGSKNAAATDGKRTAFVGNLPYTTSDSQLRKFFADSGKIDYVRINQSKKGCNGTAFVCFNDSASVVSALKLNGTEFQGRPVRVNRSEKKQQVVS